LTALLGGPGRGRLPDRPHSADDHEYEEGEDEPEKWDKKNALQETEIIPFFL